MITLRIDNSESSLEGLSISDHKVLAQVLSYSKDVFNKFGCGRRVVKVSLLDKKGRFPSGLVSYAHKWLTAQKLDFSVVDMRRRPKSQPGRFKRVLDVVPYAAQLDAIKIAEQKHQGIIAMPTGTGKSITMALLIDKLQLRTLVIVPNLELKQQLTSSFLKIFGSLEHITIENIDSASLLKHKDYDCLIIDEAHHAAAKTYRTLNKKAWTKIYHRYFFTATAFRSKSEEQLLLEGIAGQKIYEVSYQYAVDNGLIVPMEAYYVDVPKSKLKCNPKSWPAVYSELIVTNKARNVIIGTITNTLVNQNISTLCLVKEIKHGEALEILTGVPFVKGENLDNRIKILEFNLKEQIALIGTTGILGEGVDTKPCEFVIVAGLGKSRNSLMQQFGRGFRNYPDKTSCKIILFRDLSHKWTKEHFKAQCKVLLDSYGIVPVRLELGDN